MLFFLGILMAISSMDSAGVLKEVATWLDSHVPTTELVALAIGLVSALIDNVPLVAGALAALPHSSLRPTRCRSATPRFP